MFDEPQARQCSEYEDKGYQCVPYYTCDECNTIIIDGAGLFDERNTVDKCKTSRKILDFFGLIVSLPQVQNKRRLL